MFVRKSLIRCTTRLAVSVLFKMQKYFEAKLKAGSNLPNICFISFNESPFPKNTF